VDGQFVEQAGGELAEEDRDLVGVVGGGQGADPAGGEAFVGRIVGQQGRESIEDGFVVADGQFRVEKSTLRRDEVPGGQARAEAVSPRRVQVGEGRAGPQRQRGGEQVRRRVVVAVASGSVGVSHDGHEVVVVHGGPVDSQAVLVVLVRQLGRAARVLEHAPQPGRVGLQRLAGVRWGLAVPQGLRYAVHVDEFVRPERQVAEQAANLRGAQVDLLLHPQAYLAENP
jgi:hypothetical protein